MRTPRHSLPWSLPTQPTRIERYVLADDGRSATSDRIVLDDLPAKRRTKVDLSLRKGAGQPIELKRARGAIKELKEMRQDRGTDTDVSWEEKQLMMTAYPLAAEAKAAAVRDYASDFLGSLEDEKVLLFAYHHCMLDALEQTCVRSRVKCIRTL